MGSLQNKSIVSFNPHTLTQEHANTQDQTSDMDSPRQYNHLNESYTNLRDISVEEIDQN